MLLLLGSCSWLSSWLTPSLDTFSLVQSSTTSPRCPTPPTPSWGPCLGTLTSLLSRCQDRESNVKYKKRQINLLGCPSCHRPRVLHLLHLCCLLHPPQHVPCHHQRHVQRGQVWDGADKSSVWDHWSVCQVNDGYFIPVFKKWVWRHVSLYTVVIDTKWWNQESEFDGRFLFWCSGSIHISNSKQFGMFMEVHTQSKRMTLILDNDWIV